MQERMGESDVEESVGEDAVERRDARAPARVRTRMRPPRKRWFDVDHRGLGRTLGSRNKAFIISELLQNSLDEDVSCVTISFTPVQGRSLCDLVVEDDSPIGFVDLRDAYVLFGRSKKAHQPTKRGRFNVGEKLVLSLCESAMIESTTGTVVFDDSGRHEHSRRRRERGTVFRARVKLTRSEYEDVMRAINLVIVPVGVTVTINGRTLVAREPVASFDVELPTVGEAVDGSHFRTSRRTTVRVFEPASGETSCLFEMGIPVVETADRWHVDVGQKVPLGFDRDNVPPTYLRRIRTAVLNAMHDKIREADGAAEWVGAALADPDIDDEAVKSAVRARFGDKVAIFDPSDPEANHRLLAEGYNVIRGGSLTAEQWHNVKRAGAAVPSGRISPTPAPYGDSGPPEQTVPDARWTAGMRAVVEHAQWLGKTLLGATIHVRIVDEPRAGWVANYGRSGTIGTLALNVGNLGQQWFDAPSMIAVHALLVHEFGHHIEGDHLSDKYHDALCDLGAKLADVARTTPSEFDRFDSLGSTTCAT